MLQRTALTLALAALLASCQDSTESPLTAAAPAAAPAACDLLGPPTVVRYRVEADVGTQQQVQLLNGDPARATLMGCPPGAPLASVVTLRYRITEG